MTDIVQRLRQMAGEYGAMSEEGCIADLAADEIERLRGNLMTNDFDQGDVDWTDCKFPPPKAGEYLCYEPNVGPPPDFQWLRWDADRGWRDHIGNKSFPTHWAEVRIPTGKPFQCRACGLKWDDLPYYRGQSK